MQESVRKEQKRSQNTLDVADFVRDVANRNFSTSILSASRLIDPYYQMAPFARLLLFTFVVC